LICLRSVKSVANNFFRLIQADCIKALPHIETQSVDFVLTDPPFNVGLKYADVNDDLPNEVYGEWCWKWLTEFHRVLKLGHYGVVFSGDTKLFYVLKALYCSGLRFHHFLKWYKPGAQAILSGSVLFGRTELALLFSNGAPDISLINRKSLYQDTLVYRACSSKDADAVDHNARRPVALYRQIINGFTKPNDVVLDCFLGSGTSFKACVNRNCIGIEISPKVCELVKKTCFGRQILGGEYKYSFEVLE